LLSKKEKDTEAELSTNAFSIYNKYIYIHIVERLVIGSQRAEEPKHSTNRKYFKCMTNA